MRFLLLISLVCLTLMVVADDEWWTPLTGSFRLTGESIHDAELNASNDSHFLMTFEGTAAESLWNAMKVAPEENCGFMVKEVGEMACLLDNGSYFCQFSIDIANQRIVYGHWC